MVKTIALRSCRSEKQLRPVYASQERRPFTGDFVSFSYGSSIQRHYLSLIRGHAHCHILFYLESKSSSWKGGSHDNRRRNVLDTTLKVFPSFLLYPVPEEQLTAAQEAATFEDSISLTDRETRGGCCIWCQHVPGDSHRWRGKGREDHILRGAIGLVGDRHRASRAEANQPHPEYSERGPAGNLGEAADGDKEVDVFELQSSTPCS
jgi:hypothetical protein